MALRAPSKLMAKDLPYFKFMISEWNDGDITLCSLEAQGLFINLCSLYWSQEGDLSITKAKRRYNDCNTSVWDELIGDRIIKVDGDQIVINFLDEQFADREKLSHQNKKNIEKRWNKEVIDTTVIPPNNVGIVPVYNIEERRGEENRKEKKKGEEKRAEISLSEFQGLFDEIWMEQVKIVHQGKNIQQAIQEAYLHLGAENRLMNGTTSDFKKCVQSFLSNKRPENGKQPKALAFDINQKLKDAKGL